MAPKARDYLTIGEVVERLKATHADLTISKVRFLEEEGLITPDRTTGGYRIFHPADVQRLELILRLQREHFMPLAVIREKLEDLDKGKLPPEIRPVVDRAEAVPLPLEAAETVPLDRVPDLLGLPAAFIRELAEFGVVTLVAGDHGEELPGPDVAVAHTCWDLRRFGIEPRHMRMYETFAEREAAFYQQILLPAIRHRTPEARQKLVETLNELMLKTGQLKEHMVRRAVGRLFEDVT